jgi:hypothetical protein
LSAGRERMNEYVAARKRCPLIAGAQRTQMPEIRRCLAEVFYGSSLFLLC